MGRHQKSTDKWIQQVRDSLEYLEGLKVNEVHREVIRRCLESELIAAIDRYEERVALENDGTKWTTEQLEALTTYLKSLEVPKGFEEASANLETITLRLRRQQKSVKQKAAELGLTKFVSFYGY